MPQCPQCGTRNRNGVTVCQFCGSPIEAKPRKAEETVPTIHTRPKAQRFMPPALVDAMDDGKALVLAIWEDDTHLALVPVDYWDFTMGREPENTKVEIDLEPYGGHQQGVSRKHARIRRVDNDWSIEDLGSTNGTFINGEKLEPDQQYAIEDGDHIRLGQFNLQVYFKPEDRDIFS